MRNGKRRTAYCKACFRTKYNDPYYAKNKGRYRSNAARYKEQTQEAIYNYLLTHPCVDCGISDPIVLEFDHVRGVKSFTIARDARGGMSWRLIQQEIDKCEVRCCNCHRRVTAARGNWYRHQRGALGR